MLEPGTKMSEAEVRRIEALSDEERKAEIEVLVRLTDGRLRRTIQYFYAYPDEFAKVPSIPPRWKFEVLPYEGGTPQ